MSCIVVQIVAPAVSSGQLCPVQQISLVGFPGLSWRRKEGLVSCIVVQIVAPAVSSGQLCPVQQVFPHLPGWRKEGHGTCDKAHCV